MIAGLLCKAASPYGAFGVGAGRGTDAGGGGGAWRAEHPGCGTNGELWAIEPIADRTDRRGIVVGDECLRTLAASGDARVEDEYRIVTARGEGNWIVWECTLLPYVGQGFRGFRAFAIRDRGRR